MISDRTCDQNIILRPPRPLAGDFPLRGTVSQSPGDFELLDRGDVTTVVCFPAFHSGFLAGVTSHPLSQHRFASASQDGWGHPAGFVPLNAPPALYGPKTFTAGAVRCGLNARWSRWAARPATEPAGAGCGRLPPPLNAPAVWHVRRLAGARRLSDGPRCDPLTGPKYRHLDPHYG